MQALPIRNQNGFFHDHVIALADLPWKEQDVTSSVVHSWEELAVVVL
jgi:hypothetical protein